MPSAVRDIVPLVRVVTYLSEIWKWGWCREFFSHFGFTKRADNVEQVRGFNFKSTF